MFGVSRRCRITTARHSYRLRLQSNEGGGLYITDASSLEQAPDCLLTRYGERLALVMQAEQANVMS